jgi:hypothetical protein
MDTFERAFTIVSTGTLLAGCVWVVVSVARACLDVGGELDIAVLLGLAMMVVALPVAVAIAAISGTIGGGVAATAA